MQEFLQHPRIVRATAKFMEAIAAHEQELAKILMDLTTRESTPSYAFAKAAYGLGWRYLVDWYDEDEGREYSYFRNISRCCEEEADRQAWWELWKLLASVIPGIPVTPSGQQRLSDETYHCCYVEVAYHLESLSLENNESLHYRDHFASEEDSAAC